MRTLACAAVVFLLNSAPAFAQLATDEFASQGRGILAAAGYRPDTASLLQALWDPDHVVAHIATYLLSKQPSTPQIVAALRTKADSADEALAVSAFGALHTLRASDWESVAISRLSVMKEPVSGLQLSGLLAKAGRNDGWRILKAALDDGDSRLVVAIENAVHFDGLRDADGIVIDAVAELERARKRHAAKLKPMDGQSIDFAVGRVRARRVERAR